MFLVYNQQKLSFSLLGAFNYLPIAWLKVQLFKRKGSLRLVDSTIGPENLSFLETSRLSIILASYVNKVQGCFVQIVDICSLMASCHDVKTCVSTFTSSAGKKLGSTVP